MPSALCSVDERPRERAAVERLQHRRLDLEEVALVEELAHAPHEPRARRNVSRTSRFMNRSA
jgi:hypothetical protein